MMFDTYSIKDGDTLTKIAKRNGTSVAELAKLNNIEDPDKIFIGDSLIIPMKQNPSQIQEQVRAMLGQMGEGQGAMAGMPAGMSPPTSQQMPPQNVQQMPHPGMFDPQSQALQQSNPETLLGVPGMMKGLGMAAMGGLGAMAKMAPRMAPAGRMAAPAGYSNIVPMGSNGAFNSSMAQAILNSKGGLGYPAANVMRQMRTPTAGSPDVQLAQMIMNKNYPIKPGR